MNKKFNKTAYTFLLCFKYILKQRVFKINDIIEYLEDNFQITVFQETILKYIRTMKISGVQFKRLNNQVYEITKIPFEINFTDEEKDILFKQNELKDFYIAENFELFKSIIKKLSVIDVNENIDIYKNLSLFNLAEKLKQYCKDEQQLKITYTKNGEKIVNLIEPNELSIINKIIYLKCYNLTQKTNMLININNISNIKQQPIKNKFLFKEQFVILKFINKFANNYLLKDGEIVIQKNKTELIIKSFYYDKFVFFKNILRYMENCEILEPEKLKTEFKNYIKEIVQSYD